ncbi:tRNA (adenosine(37)-N6)-threonylcarbamoyltransferase complex ATPase subunit type 1 TsaE [Candidatus Sumerlaeota bacterium]|nr:tRNA (adenosine(37)-N6)-threonylcarbamoyltransferase complex ATPase subunit type 1 TsaE [Candidatus Sumerlaeota bacterium]
MTRFRWRIESPEAMAALGDAFGRHVRGGEVFRLHGNLGAGKTQWVKGLGQGLGVPEVINSPSFALIKPHQGRLALHHVDFYRLTNPRECEDLALEDLIAPDAVMAIEWAERDPNFHGWDAIDLSFEFGEEDHVRHVAIECRVLSHDNLTHEVIEEAGFIQGVTAL